MSSLSSEFQIVFHNEDFLIINKENNLSTQKNNHHSESVEEKLYKCGPPFSLLPRSGIVHRLDKDTTGLLIIAKNENSFLLFEQIFRERRIEKIYLSLHKGSPESTSGKVKFYQKKTFPKGKTVRLQTDPLVGKLVDLDFQLIKTSNQFSLMQTSPLTGRTHQIRLAFQKIGFPIYNDPVYNSELPVNKKGQYLHAWKVSFTFKKEFFRFEAKLPSFFQDEINKLGISIP